MTTAAKKVIPIHGLITGLLPLLDRMEIPSVALNDWLVNKGASAPLFTDGMKTDKEDVKTVMIGLRVFHEAGLTRLPKVQKRDRKKDPVTRAYSAFGAKFRDLVGTSCDCEICQGNGERSQQCRRLISLSAIGRRGDFTGADVVDKEVVATDTSDILSI